MLNTLASFLILRACLVACCGTGCSSPSRVSTVRLLKKNGISKFRFVNFSERGLYGLRVLPSSDPKVNRYTFTHSPFFHWYFVPATVSTRRTPSSCSFDSRLHRHLALLHQQKQLQSPSIKHCDNKGVIYLLLRPDIISAFDIKLKQSVDEGKVSVQSSLARLQCKSTVSLCGLPTPC
jgi:hypothetical protein